MDNHFNNDETRRVPLPGSEPPVPEQFTLEHFDDDREPEQPQKQPRRRRSRRRMNAGCAGSMVYMIAVVGVSLVLSIAALFMANDIFAFVKADAVKEITVSENTSVSSLAKELDDQGVINYHSVFKLYLTLKHQTDTSVLAGAYQLNPSMDYGQIVDALANTASTETVQITIPEGYSISQIRQVLLDNHICTEDALDEVLNDYSFKHDFLKDEKPAAEGWLEGYLFPDTYDFYIGDEPGRVITKFLDDFDYRFTDKMKDNLTKLQETMAARLAENGYSEEYIAAHPFTLREVMIVASMVQQEAYSITDSYLVSSVIYNRLADPDEYPFLNIDAALLYVLQGERTELTAEDLQMDSSYNTYNHTGLTPGPICNPGRNSIYAALEPQDTNYHYYALEKGTDEHHFSETLSEHEAFLASQENG